MHAMVLNSPRQPLQAVDLPVPTLGPGQSTTITVTITPSAAKGSTVKGHLYVDTISQVTLNGDELIDLPYSYKVG